MTNVENSLCMYDTRNPDCFIEDDPADQPEPDRANCYCDNCFYGRDALALEILRLRAAAPVNRFEKGE